MYNKYFNKSLDWSKNLFNQGIDYHQGYRSRSTPRSYTIKTYTPYKQKYVASDVNDYFDDHYSPGRDLNDNDSNKSKPKIIASSHNSGEEVHEFIEGDHSGHDGMDEASLKGYYNFYIFTNSTITLPLTLTPNT